MSSNTTMGEKKGGPSSTVAFFKQPNTDGNVHLLVLDIDNCSMAYYGPGIFYQRPDLLTQPIIDAFDTVEAAGFYICTHRIVNQLEFVITHGFKGASFQNFHHWREHRSTRGVSLEGYANLLKTSTIIAKLKEASKRHCFGVSTPHDKTGELGSGYQDILLPYEKKLTFKADLYHKSKEQQHSGFNTPTKPPFVFDIIPEKHVIDPKKIGYTKNAQLLKIAHHASKRYPNKHVVLHFIDDKRRIIKNANNIDKKELPSNISLQAIQFDAYTYAYSYNNKKVYQSLLKKYKISEKARMPLDAFLENEFNGLKEDDSKLRTERINALKSLRILYRKDFLSSLQKTNNLIKGVEAAPETLKVSNN